MFAHVESITDLHAEGESVRAHRYGVIEMVEGRFARLELRRRPYVGNVADALGLLAGRFTGYRHHRRGPAGRCWLYYNQPRGHASFLALKFIVSTRGTDLATFHGALVVLDEVARIKGIDALVCDAANGRISDRLFARWGWEPLGRAWWRRPFIKRFYGAYPTCRAAVGHVPCPVPPLAR